MKHYNEEHPICPHCGNVEYDAWDYGLESDESSRVDCGECGKEYAVVMRVVCTYSTGYARARPISHWFRSDLQEFLESRGFTVYNHESQFDLRQAAEAELARILA